MPRPPKTKKAVREPKRIAGYLLSESVVRAIASEALDRQCWPAHVVEEMARGRYGLPSLQRKSAHAAG